MGKDFLPIGPVPCDEPCEQLGRGYDPVKAREECRRFIDAIRATVGTEPDGARLIVTSNDHDFGTYYEVVVRYDTEDEAASTYAFRVESEAPTNWPSPSRTGAPKSAAVSNTHPEQA